MTGFSEKDREEVDAQDASDRDEITRLQKDGHTAHCSFRLIYGDGECECSKSHDKTEEGKS